MADGGAGRAHTIRIPDELWAWYMAAAAEQDREAAWLARFALADYRRRKEIADSRRHRAKPRAEGQP